MPRERLSLLLEYQREDPSDAFTCFAIAQEYLKLEQPEQALGYFEELVRDHPGYVGTYYHLGKLLERIGRKEEAINVYRSGIIVAQKQTDLHALAELRDALMKAEGVGEEDFE